VGAIFLFIFQRAGGISPQRRPGPRFIAYAMKMQWRRESKPGPARIANASPEPVAMETPWRLAKEASQSLVLRDKFTVLL